MNAKDRLIVALDLPSVAEAGVMVERIGDLVALPSEGVALTSAVDPRASGLVGQHGGPSAAETRIPCIVFRG